MNGARQNTISDHLITIREAVADVQDDAKLYDLARRTRAGEMDLSPMMEGARCAVARVLKEMFE